MRTLLRLPGQDIAYFSKCWTVCLQQTQTARYKELALLAILRCWGRATAALNRSAIRVRAELTDCCGAHNGETEEAEGMTEEQQKSGADFSNLRETPMEAEPGFLKKERPGWTLGEAGDYNCRRGGNSAGKTGVRAGAGTEKADG